MRWLLLLLLTGSLCFGATSCIDADVDDDNPDALIVEDTPDSNTTIVEDNDPPATDADVDVEVDATDDGL